MSVKSSCRLLCPFFCRTRTSPVGFRLSRRHLHVSRPSQAHGVYRGLPESRIKTPWIEALKMWKERDWESSPQEPKPPNRVLEPKKMRDSHHRVVLPLAQDPWMSDSYLNASGHIRLGTIFMDLDALAGIIAYKHTGEDVTVVTAACDRILIENPLTELCDLEYSGQVTYATGRSSLEITCKVAKAPPEGQQAKEDDVMLTCTFTMVALDPATKKPINIAPLETESPAERRLFELGEARSKHKKSIASATLLHQPPNARESSVIHNMWLRQRAYHDPNDPLMRPSNVHLMSSTKLESASIMQPQYRNKHNFVIFGGFLMKNAYELAFCCAANFARARPTFVSLDPSTFLHPVPVGSVLYLTATVAYTDPPLVDEHTEDAQAERNTSEPGTKRTRVQIRVDTKVRSVEHGTANPTGQFNYTFMVDGDVKVMPQTYQLEPKEMMMMIDARRRVQQMHEDTSREKHVDHAVDPKDRITE